ncbi:MAG: hypothetical protein ACI9FJ_002914, partial [Alteromonadaceae bacterium]
MPHEHRTPAHSKECKAKVKCKIVAMNFSWGQ